jgi:type III secretory pathway component EscV
MKISSAVLLSLAAALVVIGAHLTIKAGIVASYPLFMFAIVLLFWHMYQRNKMEESKPEEKKRGKHKSKRKKN